MGARARRWVGAMAIGMMAIGMMGMSAADAGAQPARYDFDADSAAPADTVRVEAERVAGMRECWRGNVVIGDSASLAALHERPRCRGVQSLDGRTLVGVSVMGDCFARYRIDAFRSETSRELRVRVLRRYGGCRAGRSRYEWLLLPALPPGWTVRFVERRLPDDAEVPDDFRSIRDDPR